MTKEAQIEKIKKCISELVYDKVSLKKAYNYYHCVRDAEQFRHIEDNYGIGTPTSVTFTPLIKKHIDVLVGEYLELDPSLQVSCKDDNTISYIMRDKQLKIHEAAFNFFKEKLNNVILQTFLGKEFSVDPLFDEEIKKIKKDVAKSYVSQFEIAAQNILNYIKNSRDIDLKNKMKDLLTDLLISGTCYYRTKPSSNNGLKLEVLNPLDSFIERNINEYYLNKSPRAVIRRWLSKEQILNEFGDELSSEAKDKLDSDYPVNSTDNYVYSIGTSNQFQYKSILGGLEANPLKNSMYGRNTSNYNLFPVYECEWLEYEHDRLTRYEGVRINEEIYIPRGESDTIVRSVSNPKDCSLSINGIFFEDKNGDPFSIVLNTMDLQDKYDLTIYYRDSLVASSGTLGDWIDVAHLPEFLGNELPERVQKWLAYKKQGLGLYDSSQEGSQIINTTFGGFDDTLKASMIQSFQMVIMSLEEQASSISGVFQEKLGGIQTRDAVSNVKVGVRQSSLLTKPYFTVMDSLYKEANYDLLNLAKIVFKNGICGTLINGNKLNEIFTALPEYYTMTDFDIHIQDSTEIFQAKEELKASIIELIKSGQADPSMIINIIMAKNVTELRSYIDDSIKSKKEENNIIMQLQQQLQQAQQQIQEASKQLNSFKTENDNLHKEIEKNNSIKWELEKQRIALEERKVKDNKDYNDRIAKAKEKQVEIEFLQVADSNPYNDKVKNV